MRMDHPWPVAGQKERGKPIVGLGPLKTPYIVANTVILNRSRASAEDEH